MTHDRLRFLFNRYVSQKISETEKEELFELIAHAELDETLKELIDELWHSVPADKEHMPISGTVYQNVIGHTSGKIQSKTVGKFQWLRVAASIGVIAIASFVIYLYSSSRAGQPQAISEYVNTNNHNSFMRLPDGSTVVLNEESTLKFPDSFDGASTREVYLEGEAFFDIQHDPSKPFIVRSGNVSTTVLGTAFNIKAFASDKEVVVTVTRGKVQVSADKKVLGILSSDQQITVNKKSAKVAQETGNTQEVLAWMEHDIFFEDATMEEAIQELEHRFDVKIHLLNDQIKDCRFTATFVKGEDIDQILLVICEFNKASFHRMSSGNIIEIDGAGCQ
jgi:transmembrane sensor